MASAESAPHRWLVVALLVALAAGAVQPATASVRAIRVVVDNDYAPYSFRSDQGELEGIVIDQWKLWETKTGLKADIQAMNWAEAVERMRAGEFDVIDCIAATDKRRAYLDFMPPYAVVEASIFFRNDVSGITDLASLRGFPVGVKAGDQHIDKLRDAGITTLIPFANNGAIIKAAQERKINVFVVDAPSALYLLNRKGLAKDFRRSAPVFRDELRRAVHKGDVKTLSAVSGGFAAMSPDELKRIDQKWFGRTTAWYEPHLVYVGYAALLALLIIGALTGWNHALRKKVLQRTAALKESEVRFRQIAENIREVVWLSAADSLESLYISPAYEAVWGRPRDGLYQDPHSFGAAVHPEDRLRVAEEMETHRERGFEAEYRVVRPDGSVRWIRDRGFPIKDEAGRVYRLAGIAEDITDRKLATDALKEAEDRIRLMIDTIPTMVWGLRSDGALDFVNQPWLLYTGLSVEEAIADATLTVHPDDLQRVLEKWKIDMANGVASEDEMRLRRADGDYRWFLIRTVPLHDGHGNIVYWYGASTDIEDSKRAEEALKTTTEQLRALSATLRSAREEEGTRIAREIHDDLGATLTGLRWELEGVKKAICEPGRVLPDLDLAAKLSAMLDLTDTMVTTVRRIASDLRPVVLDVLGLEDAIEWQARQFQDRTGIAVHCVSAGLGFELSPTQSTAVFRIFQEALTNVLRHSRATRVDVTLAIDTGVLVLMVGDNGRGITESERIGESSIGLLGMRERAQLIGGEIDVSGVEGEGTTVTLRLPLVYA
jgi:PAS domain S-box-containing protein